MKFKNLVEDKFPFFCDNPHVSSLLDVIDDLENKGMGAEFIDSVSLLTDYFKDYISKIRNRKDFEAFNQLVSDYLG